jgi:hypothetical protein
MQCRRQVLRQPVHQLDAFGTLVAGADHEGGGRHILRAAAGRNAAPGVGGQRQAHPQIEIRPAEFEAEAVGNPDIRLFQHAQAGPHAPAVFQNLPQIGQIVGRKHQEGRPEILILLVLEAQLAMGGHGAQIFMGLAQPDRAGTASGNDLDLANRCLLRLG